MTHVFVGLMVLFRITEEQAKATNIRREDARQNRDKMREERPGFQAHVGTMVAEGDRCPMIITQVWADGVINGQAFLDGSDSLWVCMIQKATLRDSLNPSWTVNETPSVGLPRGSNRSTTRPVVRRAVPLVDGGFQ